MKVGRGRIKIKEIATVGERVGRKVEDASEMRAFP
jgi:hypothetical protein